jgi:murein tripeptide amidase MpaA
MYFSIVCLQSLALAASYVAGLPLETAATTGSVSYDGYKAFRIDTPDNLAEVLETLQNLRYDQWNFNSRKYLDISLSPDQLDEFESLGLDYTVMHRDLGAAISAERDSTVESSRGLRVRQSDWFDSYHSYADHIQYFKDLHSAYPNTTEIVSQGKSVEDRDLYGLKLFGSGSGGNGTKEAIVFHGNVHAREWITSMTVEYITNELLTGYKSGDSDIKSILDNYDMYIFPIVNPDGFVYTQTNNRLWRKNRNPAPSGSNCVGIDLNRNWPYKWDVTNGQGSSGDPCDETYRGAKAGDQPETAGMAGFVDKVAAKQDIKLYVDFHSYGQYILTPYGWTCDSLPPNNDQHISLGNGMAKAVAAKYGTQFTVGPSCETLYATDGSSTDYVLDVGKAELTYAFELRDEGRFGFVLPANQIRPSGVEIWEGVRTMLLDM